MMRETGVCSEYIPKRDPHLDWAVRVAALSVAFLALGAGLVVPGVVPQWALFPAAFVLGWTQLVGL